MAVRTQGAVQHEGTHMDREPFVNDEPRAPLRRIVALFRPYRGRLAVVGLLVGAVLARLAWPRRSCCGRSSTSPSPRAGPAC